jgi:tRNA(His) 5'-end guanylyltransferase
MDNTSLGDRIKMYENVERKYLTRRLPTIIRVDGEHFHSYTRGFDRPFDLGFIAAMQQTAKQLCENIMGAKIAYTQSDEITILLRDDDTLVTQAWFDKNLQKIVSTASSMATYFFNKNIARLYTQGLPSPVPYDWFHASAGVKKAYSEGRLAIFDARAFIVPPEEVMNVFEWRQQDCIRNSIQMIARAHFSHSELIGVSCADMQTRLLDEKNVDVENYDVYLRRGSCVVKDATGHWTIDTHIPIFHEDPTYVVVERHESV